MERSQLKTELLYMTTQLKEMFMKLIVTVVTFLQTAQQNVGVMVPGTRLQNAYLVSW